MDNAYNFIYRSHFISSHFVYRRLTFNPQVGLHQLGKDTPSVQGFLEKKLSYNSVVLIPD